MHDLTRLDRKIKCPTCGAEMRLKETSRFKWKNGRNKLFYGCTLWPICETILGSHPDGMPYGVPADKETKKLRRRCHIVLNSWGLSNTEAYQLVQRIMEIKGADAHFGCFTKEQCLEFLARTEGRELETLTSEGQT